MLVPLSQRQPSAFLRVATNNNRTKHEFIHLVYNRDMKAERNGASRPAWLDGRPAFILPGDIVPVGGQKTAYLK